MTTIVTKAMKNALNLFTEYRNACRKDGYDALADDMTDVMKELDAGLGYLRRQNAEDIRIVEGLDQNLYLVFPSNGESITFLESLGSKAPLHHCGGFENAVLIQEWKPQYGHG